MSWEPCSLFRVQVGCQSLAQWVSLRRPRLKRKVVRHGKIPPADQRHGTALMMSWYTSQIWKVEMWLDKTQNMETLCLCPYTLGTSFIFQITKLLLPWPLWFTGGLLATFTTIVGHPVNTTTMFGDTPKLFWSRKLMNWMASDLKTDTHTHTHRRIFWIRYFNFFNLYWIKKTYIIRQFLKDLAMVYIPRYGCWLPKFLAIPNPREIPDSNLASLFDQCARLILKRSQIPKKRRWCEWSKCIGFSWHTVTKVTKLSTRDLRHCILVYLDLTRPKLWGYHHHSPVLVAVSYCLPALVWIS